MATRCVLIETRQAADSVVVAQPRPHTPLQPLEQALEGQRQRCCRHGAGQQQRLVVERQAGDDALAITARADEGRDGGRADRDAGGGARLSFDRAFRMVTVSAVSFK